MHPYYNHMASDGWGLGVGFLMMLFWATIIVLVVVLILRSMHGHNANRSDDDALDIAKKRYAKGKITKKEFEQFKNDLK